MTTLGNRHVRTPDWQVTAVFDPHGEGQDFAYTVGLVDRGLPELHLWARPSLGDDPGADWMFSPQDCFFILNELAWRLIDGEVSIGDRWEQAYDDGQVTCRFRLDPPGDRDELQAYGVMWGAEVLPVRWSLHRRPIGRPRPLGKRSLERASAEYAAILDRLGDDAAVPEGWTLPPAFEPGGEFGPLTPMVAARVAELWSGDAITLGNLLWAAVTMRQGGSITWSAAAAHALARDVGRVDEAARTKDASIAVVEARTDRPDWPQIEREVGAVIGFEPGEIGDGELRRSVHGNLGELLWTVLVTEVVADRLTKEQRLHGRGAWLSGLGPVGDLPGPEWRAPRPVLDRLYAALRPLSTASLLQIARRHLDDDLEEFQRLAGAVQGWALTAPAGCPFAGGLDRLPGVTWPRALDDLQEWATVMTSAACHRDAALGRRRGDADHAVPRPRPGAAVGDQCGRSVSMPKSRARKSGRRSAPKGTRPPNQPFRSITSQLTPAHERAVCESADAELRGDAATALSLHRSVPFFRRSTHCERLQQLADLGPAAPGWIVNRWVTVQARRRAWSGGDQSGTNRMLQLLVPLIYPDHIPFERIGCEHPEQVPAWINELDWVVRQADVYDLGALRRFINDQASDELLERTDEIIGWADALMRAWRVEYVDRERTRPMRVQDLTSGEELELLDLGAAVEPGQHVLGRVVPISTAPGAMFDWRPMPVGAEAAEAVAEDPRRWLTTVNSLLVDGVLEPGFAHLPEASLTSDLDHHAWMTEQDRSDHVDPRSVVESAVREALTEPSLQAGNRHRLGDLVLDATFDPSVRWRFVSPDLVAAWDRLARALPDHARPRCEEMAMWCAAAPELPDATA